MEKFDIHFIASDWLATDLEAYQKQHPDSPSKKDLVENYILSLRDQIIRLEASLQYEKDSLQYERDSGKIAAPPQTLNQDSSTQTTAEARQSQETQVNLRAPSNEIQTVTIRGKAYRIRPSQTDTAVWQEGVWTFSQKKAEALAFVKEVEAQRTTGVQEREAAKTAGAAARAQIKETTARKTSRQPGQGQLEDGCPHGAPVDDMVV